MIKHSAVSVSAQIWDVNTIRLRLATRIGVHLAELFHRAVNGVDQCSHRLLDWGLKPVVSKAELQQNLTLGFHAVSVPYGRARLTCLAVSAA